MMVENAIAVLHSEYMDAWQRDDRKAAMSYWSDDIIMRAAGCNPHAGVYTGKTEVQRNLIDRIVAETSEAEVPGLVDIGFGAEYVFTIVHERLKKRMAAFSTRSGSSFTAD